MEEYVLILKEYLGNKRNSSKKVYKICASIYRAEKNNRITFDEALNQLRELYKKRRK